MGHDKHEDTKSEKTWSKLDVHFNEFASGDRTSVDFGYSLFDGDQEAHACTVSYNNLPAAGIAGVRAAWLECVEHLAKRKIFVSSAGSTTLTSVPNATTHELYRGLQKTLRTLTEWGERESRSRGRSVHKD